VTDAPHSTWVHDTNPFCTVANSRFSDSLSLFGGGLDRVVNRVGEWWSCPWKRSWHYIHPDLKFGKSRHRTWRFMCGGLISFLFRGNVPRSGNKFAAVVCSPRQGQQLHLWNKLCNTSETLHTTTFHFFPFQFCFIPLSSV